MTVPSIPPARLDITHGPLQGNSFDLIAPETIVGREVGCQIVLDSYNQVSRRHARFYVRRGEWCIEDLGATNGTYVNSARANPSFLLVDGAQIQLGDFHARFRLSGVNLQPGSAHPTQIWPAPPAPGPAPIPPVAPVPVMPVPQPYPVIYPVQPPKQVGLAILFSFLLVGGGQFYNGESGKGVSMLLGAMLCGFLAMFTCGLTAIGCTILWVISMVDAAQNAERINREASWPRSY